jgi:hypothetical protein
MSMPSKSYLTIDDVLRIDTKIGDHIGLPVNNLQIYAPSVITVIELGHYLLQRVSLLSHTARSRNKNADAVHHLRH